MRATNLIKPAALRRGDTIAVVSPAGPVQPARLARGIALLEERGYRVRSRPDEATAPFRYFAASEPQRRAQLIEAFDDPTVRAVWCARGGYGSGRLLPALDVDRLRARAKLLIGFSDVTALLQLMVVKARVAAVHGPMVGHDLAGQDPAALDHLFAMLEGAKDWRIDVPRGVRAGSASAPLLGGCLTVLASLAGTPFAPRFDGAIVLLEDTHERPLRRVDRLLTQLAQSGMLSGAAGIVFGAMPDCGDADELCAAIDECLGGLDVPIGFGAPLGHGAENFAVPLGVRVRLTVERVDVCDPWAARAQLDDPAESAAGRAAGPAQGEPSRLADPAGSLSGIESVVS